MNTYTIRNDQGDFSHIWSGLEPQDFATFARCLAHVESYVQGIAASFDTDIEASNFVSAVGTADEIGAATSAMARWVVEQNVTDTLPEGATWVTPGLFTESYYASPGGWSKVTVRGISRGVVEVTRSGDGFRPSTGLTERWHEVRTVAIRDEISIAAAGETSPRGYISVTTRTPNDGALSSNGGDYHYADIYAPSSTGTTLKYEWNSSDFWNRHDALQDADTIAIPWVDFVSATGKGSIGAAPVEA